MARQMNYDHGIGFAAWLGVEELKTGCDMIPI